MPASGAINLIDANVWLAASADGHTHYTRPKQWFDGQAELSCAMCRVTQTALLRHLTNSKIMGVNVQSQSEAWKTYDKLMEDSRVVFIAEPAGLETEFRQLTQSDSPSNALWTDAYLAAFATCSRAGVVTFDQGFRRFPKLDTLILS